MSRIAGGRAGLFAHVSVQVRIPSDASPGTVRTQGPLIAVTKCGCGWDTALQPAHV